MSLLLTGILFTIYIQAMATYVAAPPAINPANPITNVVTQPGNFGAEFSGRNGTSITNGIDGTGMFTKFTKILHKRALFSCESSYSQQVVRKCTTQILEILAQTEKATLKMLNTTFIMAEDEFYTDLKIHMTILSLFKIFSNTPSTDILVLRLDNLVHKFSKQVNDSRKRINDINNIAKSFDDSKIVIPKIFDKNYMASAAMLLSLFSMLLHCVTPCRNILFVMKNHFGNNPLPVQNLPVIAQPEAPLFIPNHY